MFPRTHLSCSRVSVYESTSPGGFSHDAWRLRTPELLRVMVRSAMGTATHTDTFYDPLNQKGIKVMIEIVFLCVLFICIFFYVHKTSKFLR